jgi:hypothetical protein
VGERFLFDREDLAAERPKENFVKKVDITQQKKAGPKTGL